MKLLIICFLFLACQDPVIIDPVLQVHVNAFVKQAEIRGRNLTVNDVSVIFGEINTTGSFSEKENEIIISRGITDSLALQYIVFHEIGHYYGRNHNNKYSIMNPNTYAAAYRNKPLERDSLISELIKGIKK